MEDRLPDAIRQLREALRIDPGYLNAHYNLARALAATGDVDDAGREYATFLATKPDDAAAQAGLGTILFHQRRFPDALAHFREAARLDPNNADMEANLGTLLAISGDLPAAAEAFERALRIDPNHEAARANLAKVRLQLAGKK